MFDRVPGVPPLIRDRRRAPPAPWRQRHAHDVDVRVVGNARAILPDRDVVDTGRRRAGVLPPRAVVHEEAEVLQGPGRTWSTGVPGRELDDNGGLEPVALGAERHAPDLLVPRVRLLQLDDGEEFREDLLRESAEMVGVRREQFRELGARAFDLWHCAPLRQCRRPDGPRLRRSPECGTCVTVATLYAPPPRPRHTRRVWPGRQPWLTARRAISAPGVSRSAAPSRSSRVCFSASGPTPVSYTHLTLPT